MPPLPAAFEAACSTPKRREHHIPRTITTQGNMFHARDPAVKATNNTDPCAATSAVPVATGTYPCQRVTRNKPQSLPPPGEMTQHAEEDLRAAELRAARRAGTTKRYRRAENPMTMQQKIAAARAANEGERDNQDGRRGSEMASREKVPGLTKQLEMQSRRAGWGVSSTGGIEYIPFTNRFVSAKVLRFREMLEKNGKDGVVLVLTKAKPKKGHGRNKEEKKQKQKKKKRRKENTFRFLDLPDEVKARIYRLVAVNSKLCVWPASVSDREQPDISMVCTEIRSAVLPIYYGENTLGVDIAPPVDRAKNVHKVVQKSSQASKKQPITGLVAVQRWAETLSAKRNERGKCYAAIKNWCFSYQDPFAGFESSKAIRNSDITDESFVVSVRFPQIEHEEIKIEVHRRAACVMPGWADCGECTTVEAPAALYAAVTTWLRGGVQEPKGLIDFVLEMRKLVEQLACRRCENVKRSIKVVR